MVSIAQTRRMASGEAEQLQALAPRYDAVRRATEELCRPLATEDYGLQAMPDASPPKWHLAHTTWFFETFLLKPFLHAYSVFHPRYEYLFNSYYQTIGRSFRARSAVCYPAPRWPRSIAIARTWTRPWRRC